VGWGRVWRGMEYLASRKSAHSHFSREARDGFTREIVEEKSKQRER
jgi:hypothetical protein